jgi:site-specific recombinase XerD
MAPYKVYRKKADNSGEASICVSFYIGREKIEAPTKTKTGVKSFDRERGTVKNSDPFASDKNLIISGTVASINNVFVKYRLRERELTKSLFWKEYGTQRTGKDFRSFCTGYRKLRFQELAWATQKAHRSALQRLWDFRGELYFEDLTTGLFREFVLYLRKKKGNNENTIRKTVKTIAVYINEAVRKHYLPESPLSELKLRGGDDSKVEYLQPEELTKLAALQRSHTLPANLQEILDFFLFMCYSSLHITDARNFTVEQTGKHEFVYNRTKMLNIRPRTVHVPVSKPLRLIIEQYGRGRRNGKLFERPVNNQQVNKNLKSVAEKAGIKKNLSAKVGRHTFATIYLRGTKDLNALKEIMATRTSGRRLCMPMSSIRINWTGSGCSTVLQCEPGMPYPYRQFFCPAFEVTSLRRRRTQACYSQ